MSVLPQGEAWYSTSWDQLGWPCVQCVSKYKNQIEMLLMQWAKSSFNRILQVAWLHPHKKMTQCRKQIERPKRPEQFKWRSAKGVGGRGHGYRLIPLCRGRVQKEWFWGRRCDLLLKNWKVNRTWWKRVIEQDVGCKDDVSNLYDAHVCVGCVGEWR